MRIRDAKLLPLDEDDEYPSTTLSVLFDHSEHWFNISIYGKGLSPSYRALEGMRAYDFYEDRKYESLEQAYLAEILLKFLWGKVYREAYDEVEEPPKEYE